VPHAFAAPGYLTKQESVPVSGAANLWIRSLLDKQQFHDPNGTALRLGISSAMWPLFGLLWPSGAWLAQRMALHPMVIGQRMLEIGCGLALPSLIGHRRGANMTASDCHPLAGTFLRENLRLNCLAPMSYRHGHWGEQVQAGTDPTLAGRFDVIMGSDILYERDERGALAHFIDQHAAKQCEVWVVDPNRGNRSHFHRNMSLQGFALSQTLLEQPATPEAQAYKGCMLTYRRD
jgi:predicted nicotinamide N-methyase